MLKKIKTKIRRFLHREANLQRRALLYEHLRLANSEVSADFVQCKRCKGWVVKDPDYERKVARYTELQGSIPPRICAACWLKEETDKLAKRRISIPSNS